MSFDAISGLAISGVPDVDDVVSSIPVLVPRRRIDRRNAAAMECVDWFIW